jgi:hypothetical protein
MALILRPFGPSDLVGISLQELQYAAPQLKAPQVKAGAVLGRPMLRFLAAIMALIMIPHAADAQSSPQRASLSGFEHRDAELNDGVRLHENCAHFVPEEQPSKTAELILRFFAEGP